MRTRRGAEFGPRGTPDGTADTPSGSPTAGAGPHPDPDPDADPDADPDPDEGTSGAGPGRPGQAGDGQGDPPTEQLDLAVWLALVAVGLGLTVLAVRAGARLGTGAAPFLGRYELVVTPASLLAPAVAAVVLVAAAKGVHERLRWPVLLLAGYAAAAGWALALVAVDGGSGLARGLAGPEEYLADVPKVGTDPGGFLDRFAEAGPELTPATRDHPPLPVLLLWAAGRLGLDRPVQLGLAVTLVGALVTPLVAVAVRSLSGEPAARRLVPVLALAPYAVWLAVSMDAVTAALGAGFIAVAAVGSRPGRPGPARLAWACLCGLLMGTAALFSYSVIWLAATVPCLYFVRRRPLLNVASGVCALLPLAAAQAAGFTWSEGLAASRRDLAERVGDERSALVWGLLGLFVLLLAGGPALVASARKLRLTPAWPYLVGGGLGVAWAIVAGLARGEAERSWLPFFGWLLVAAVAPESRGGPPPRLPLLLAGTGALTAICLQAVLRSPW